MSITASGGDIQAAFSAKRFELNLHCLGPSRKSNKGAAPRRRPVWTASWRMRKFWCERRDSNPYTFRRWNPNPVRPPIPPPHKGRPYTSPNEPETIMVSRQVIHEPGFFADKWPCVAAELVARATVCAPHNAGSSYATCFDASRVFQAFHCKTSVVLSALCLHNKYTENVTMYTQLYSASASSTLAASRNKVKRNTYWLWHQPAAHVDRGADRRR